MVEAQPNLTREAKLSRRCVAKECFCADPSSGLPFFRFPARPSITQETNGRTIHESPTGSYTPEKSPSAKLRRHRSRSPGHIVGISEKWLSMEHIIQAANSATQGSTDSTTIAANSRRSDRVARGASRGILHDRSDHVATSDH